MYNKTFPASTCRHYLMQKIKQKEAQGWQLVGEIKQNLEGRYSCMMIRESKRPLVVK